MATWLLVDATYICHRAWHSVGHLSHNGESTGVAFGFLNEIDRQRDLHGAANCVMAFDAGGPGLRHDLLPSYKSTRRNKKRDDVEQDQRRDRSEQMKRLRKTYLPDLGYRNVVGVRGYEADDIIAAAAQRLPDGDEGVILTSDADLLQCISHNVRFHNPAKQKTTTLESFIDEWGIDPVEWASVKAIAGCSTDDIPGIPGIGDKTAAKWFAGTLKETVKAYNKIVDNLEIHNENIKLTRLPFPGLEIPKLRQDELTNERRRDVYDRLGFGRGGSTKSASKKKKRKGFGLL